MRDKDIQANFFKIFDTREKKFNRPFLVDFFANFQTELQFKTFISRLILNERSSAVCQNLS